MTPQYAWFFTVLLLVGGFVGFRVYQRKILNPFESKTAEVRAKDSYKRLRALTLNLIRQLPRNYRREFLKTLYQADDSALSAKRRKEIFVAEYSLVVNTLYLFGKRGANLALYPAVFTLIILIALWVYPFFKSGDDDVPTKKLPTKYLPQDIPKKWKKACDYVYSVIATEPIRPASIYYHEQRTGGLLRHSLNVMRYYVKNMTKNNDLTFDEIGLVTFLGLAHDAGKRFVYYPVYNRGLFGRKKVLGWKSRFSPIPAHTKVIIAEALNYAGLSEKIKLVNLIIDPNPLVSLSEFQRKLRRVLIQTDGFVTFNEMFIVPKNLEKDYVNAFKEALESLNVNRIYTGDNEGFYFPDRNLFIVYAWAIAQRVSNVLVNKYGVPKAYQYGVGARTRKELHPIIPPLSVALKNAGKIYTEYNGVKADRLSLYNGEIRQKGYKKPQQLKGFFVVKLDWISPKLIKKWERGMAFIKDFEYVKIVSRKDPSEAEIEQYYTEITEEDGVTTEFEFGLQGESSEETERKTEKKDEVSKLL